MTGAVKNYTLEELIDHIKPGRMFIPQYDGYDDVNKRTVIIANQKCLILSIDFQVSKRMNLVLLSSGRTQKINFHACSVFSNGMLFL